jgi:hypothetical protein
MKSAQYSRSDPATGNSADDVSYQATQQSPGLIDEFVLFVRWWLLPVLVLLLIAAVLIIGGIALAPSVFRLFSK